MDEKRGGGTKGKGASPVERAIRDLVARGRTARIAVDALSAGVDVPESVRTRWGHALILDLDPGMPLNLDYDETALFATLSFSPVLCRCAIPYRAIYAVLDRATGAGNLFQEHIPAEQEAASEGGERRAKGSRRAAGRELMAEEALDGDPVLRRSRFRLIRGGKD